MYLFMGSRRRPGDLEGVTLMARVHWIAYGCSLVFGLGILQPLAAAEGLFPDSKLEAVVRKYVFAKRDNSEPLTEEDVRNISTIEGKNQGIRDLRGLDKCLSLASLDLEGNDIADLDPIGPLVNIQMLVLSKNRIGDLSALEKLVNLQYLDLAHNRVVDLEPLSGMTNLRNLYLSHNRVRDLSVLSHCPKMWSLYVDHNRLASIDVVSQLKWLTSLDLRHNTVSDLQPISQLTELKYLFLDGNKVEDLSVLVDMARRDVDGPKRFAQFWHVYLADNPLSDTAKTEQVEALSGLGVRVSLEPTPE
jgi:internalin A